MAGMNWRRLRWESRFAQASHEGLDHDDNRLDGAGTGESFDHRSRPAAREPPRSTRDSESLAHPSAAVYAAPTRARKATRAATGGERSIAAEQCRRAGT